MLASSFPVLDVFLEILYFFLLVLWFFILFQVVIDLFRSPDLTGVHKALWFIFVILVPFLGVFVYIVARGSKMHEHQAQAVQSQQQAMDDYIKQAAGTSAADQLTKLHDLKEKGAISDGEYETAKAKIISA
jgi:ABC-type multidrug transport system fused ATPase/permease subunit